MRASARSRYFSSHWGLCSLKSSSPCGLPQSTSATLMPASDSRLAAHPPDAPEPTTMQSNLRESDGCGTRASREYGRQTLDSGLWTLDSGLWTSTIDYGRRRMIVPRESRQSVIHHSSCSILHFLFCI